MQSLIRMHYCRNIITALSYALKVEAASRASHPLAIIYQLRGECPKDPKSPFSEEVKVKKQSYCVAERHVTHRKKHAA